MNTYIMDRREILENARTIAMIGCSADKFRTSNYAAKFLMDKGYRVIPVNPQFDEILGEKCYPSLLDIPETEEIDIVNIFRNSAYSAKAVQDVADWKDKTGQNPVVWTQLDVSSQEGENIAEAHGLSYVRNMCIMVEYDRLLG